jgi:hypothetical protein
MGILSLAFALTACANTTESTFQKGGGEDGGRGGSDGGNESDGSFAGNSSKIVLLFGHDGGADTGGSDGGSQGCSGLSCQIHTCDSGSTTISGTIYDPAGVNPLYDIVAYVPNTTPQPFPSGAACTPCNALYTGDPIATALTDASGKFTIANAPDGTNIPLVIQVGKWRKQLTIPTVTQCQDNPQPDKSLTLPKNHDVGDIPMIAISTGGADTLECLLTRVGLDATEYSPGGGGAGHIQIFQGGAGAHVGAQSPAPNTAPPGPESYLQLWDSSADLLKYDIVLLSCEGEETQDGVQGAGGETQTPLTVADQTALLDYAAGGGRVFASHFHYAWFNSGPFGAANLATWTTGGNDMGTINADVLQTLPNGNAFPKGVALYDWLGNVGALNVGPTAIGELPIQAAKHNADVTAANTLSTPWIVADTTANPAGATEYISFDTPLGAAADKVCGRVVYSDLHVGAASHDQPTMPIPAECTPGKLSPQEDALEFMLFDLSSCVTPNSVTPTPPIPTQPK